MKAGPEEKLMVQQMIAGDEAAFERFSDGYIPALYRFAIKRLQGDRELARDVVQSTLCKVIEKLASFRGDAALMTWLCAVCRNEIAGHFRRGKKYGAEVEFQEYEDLFGASMSVDVLKIGERQVMVFRFDGINDRFAPKIPRRSSSPPRSGSTSTGRWGRRSRPWPCSRSC